MISPGPFLPAADGTSPGLFQAFPAGGVPKLRVAGRGKKCWRGTVCRARHLYGASFCNAHRRSTLTSGS